MMNSVPDFDYTMAAHLAIIGGDEIRAFVQNAREIHLKLQEEKWVTDSLRRQISFLEQEIACIKAVLNDKEIF